MFLTMGEKVVITHCTYCSSELSSYLQLKRTCKMACPFTAPISGSYSMVRCSRLTQSSQLHLGTALEEDKECMWRWVPTCSLKPGEERETGAEAHLGGWRGCVGTWVEEEAVLGLTWVEEGAGVGPPLGWCWAWFQCLAEAASPVPWHQACMLRLPRSEMAAPWSERH